jgi:hypothetical protein
MTRVVPIYLVCAMLALSSCSTVPLTNNHTQTPLDVLTPSYTVDKLLEWEGQYGSKAIAEHKIINDEIGWMQLWQSLGKDPPPLDFNKYYAVAVMAGMRRTGGYTIEFLEPIVQGVDVTVRYFVKTPSGYTMSVITYPWKVRAFLRVPGKAFIENISNT